MLAVSDHLSREAYQGAWDIPGLELVRGTGDVLEKSRAALVCSGTATLESSLHGVPFVVCYRTGKLNYLLARILVSGVDRIGMANIVAGQDVAPELIQHRATSENMVRELTPSLRTTPSGTMPGDPLKGCGQPWAPVTPPAMPQRR